MKAGAALSHWSSPCAPRHAGTRLCISLPFSISFIANIARKRPELNRDKSNLRLDHMGSEQDARARGPSFSLRPILRAMERKDRRELGRLIQKAQSKISRWDRDAHEVMNARLADTMAAAPFDSEAVLALMEEISTDTLRRLDVARKILLESIATMSEQDRQILAQRLRKTP